MSDEFRGAVSASLETAFAAGGLLAQAGLTDDDMPLMDVAAAGQMLELLRSRDPRLVESVGTLDLPAPVEEALIEAGITTLGKLVRYSKYDLMAIDQISTGRVGVIVAALTEIDLELYQP